jgi:hypothetical protein
MPSVRADGIDESGLNLEVRERIFDVAFRNAPQHKKRGPAQIFAP